MKLLLNVYDTTFQGICVSINIWWMHKFQIIMWVFGIIYEKWQVLNLIKKLNITVKNVQLQLGKL